MKKISLICILFIHFAVQAKDYKGAEIYSNQSYLYGRFEMSIQAAPGSGQISTFFLYRNESETNTTLWQEIDIEIFGKTNNMFQSNVIIEKQEGTQIMSEAKHTTVENLHTSLNTYVVEWTPDSICWYINGELVRTETEKAEFCNAEMSIRFNHWAANNVGWVGAFNTDVLPQYQYVDYVSYAAYTPGVGDDGTDFTLDWTDDFTTFNTSRWSKANWTFGGNLCDFVPENAYIENDMLVLKLHSTRPPTKISSVEFSGNSLFKNLYSGEIIESELHKTTISIHTMEGQALVSQLSVAAIGMPLKEYLHTLSPGVYIVQLFKNGQIQETQKFGR